MFHTLNQFIVSMLQHHSLDDLLWDMAAVIGQLLDINDCVIYLLRDDALVQVAAYGIKNPTQRTIAEPIVIPVGEGIVGTVALTRAPEFVPDTRLDPRYISDQYEGFSELAVPILFQDQLLGVLDSEADQPNAYNEEDLALFQAIANAAASRIAWLLSEQRRAQEEEARHMERIEALGRLAGGIAHDFNNLMTVTSLSIDQLLHADAHEDQLEASEMALNAIDQARSLTQQLMTFGSGGKPLFEEVDLEPLLRDALRILHDTETLEVTADISPDLPTIWGDPSQLEQVLQNLLLNAAAATQQAGRVTLTAHPQDGASGRCIVVSVQDTGPGIPSHVKEHIFDPYFSTESSSIGLGLSTAYWIVRRHDGVLTVSNEENGACFTFRLPALRVKVAHSESAVIKPLPPLNILILDDEAEVAMGLQRLLIRQGHRAVSVTDGTMVAPTWVKHQRAGSPFHIAILDLVNSNGTGGLAALEMLRSAAPQSRAIVMSGYSEDPVMSDYRYHGFNGRLSKPFRSSELNAIIAHALRSTARPSSIS